MTETTPGKRPFPFRIFSLEGLFGAFALFSLSAGLWRGEIMPIFWGVTILTGLTILLTVRRRDWKKHWAEMDRLSDSRRETDRTP